MPRQSVRHVADCLEARGDQVNLAPVAAHRKPTEAEERHVALRLDSNPDATHTKLAAAPHQ